MTLKTCAAFTMSREEPLWLFVWLNHYGRELGVQNCFVLHEPVDPTIDHAKRLFRHANFHAVPSRVPGEFKPGHYDMNLEKWRLSVVKRWQTDLLGPYEAVIFTDTDEFLVPDEGIIPWVQTRLKGRTHVRSECWSPVDSLTGAQIIPGESALRNCRQMWRLPLYDKTLLVTKPQSYSRGFHCTYGIDGTGGGLDGSNLRKRIADPIDPTLPMCHAWRSDFDDWWRDAKWRYNITVEQGKQYFRDHDPKLLNTPGDPHVVGEPREVPESWRRKLVIPHDR